jgi:hypothetical protein
MARGRYVHRRRLKACPTVSFRPPNRLNRAKLLKIDLPFGKRETGFAKRELGRGKTEPGFARGEFLSGRRELGFVSGELVSDGKELQSVREEFPAW